MLKISYTSKEGLKELREKYAKECNNSTGSGHGAMKEHAFLFHHMPGWLILEAAKNFVPADFVEDKNNPQAIKEGWKAVRLLKGMLRRISDPKEHPGMNYMFNNIPDGDGNDHTLAVKFVIHSLKDCLELWNCVDEEDAPYVNLNDYCSAIVVFESLLMTGFQSISREAFWDDFVYRILSGDVPQEPDPPYRSKATL